MGSVSSASARLRALAATLAVVIALVSHTPGAAAKYDFWERDSVEITRYYAMWAILIFVACQMVFVSVPYITAGFMVWRQYPNVGMGYDCFADIQVMNAVWLAVHALLIILNGIFWQWFGLAMSLFFFLCHAAVIVLLAGKFRTHGRPRRGVPALQLSEKAAAAAEPPAHARAAVHARPQAHDADGPTDTHIHVAPAKDAYAKPNGGYAPRQP